MIRTKNTPEAVKIELLSGVFLVLQIRNFFIDKRDFSFKITKFFFSKFIGPNSKFIFQFFKKAAEMYPFVKKDTVTQYLFCHSLKGMTKQALCFAPLLRKESFLNLIELPS